MDDRNENKLITGKWINIKLCFILSDFPQAQ